jgi:hypothetical protein
VGGGRGLEQLAFSGCWAGFLSGLYGPTWLYWFPGHPTSSTGDLPLNNIQAYLVPPHVGLHSEGNEPNVFSWFSSRLAHGALECNASLVAALGSFVVCVGNVLLWRFGI